jgi:hypothetical protein
MVNIVIYFWNLFVLWIETIFVIPFKNWDMLWLLVPVWIAWFFAEFYQEKVGTSRGNAITNAVVVIWGSIDCTRQTARLIASKAITSGLQIFTRFALIAVIFAYGLIIVNLGMKGRKIVKYIGRVRVVTYVFVMFVPILYNTIPFSVEHLVAAIVFFPLYYGIIELIDRIAPNPQAIIEDLKEMEMHAVHNKHPTNTHVGTYQHVPGNISQHRPK